MRELRGRFFLAIFVFALLMAWATDSHCQTSAVSATVVDTAGQIFANGTYRIEYQNAPGQTNAPTRIDTGTQLLPSDLVKTGSLSAGGAFATTLIRTDNIAPKGGNWKIQVCPNASSQCSYINAGIAAPTYDATAALTSAIGSLNVDVTVVPNTPYAYRESEVSGQRIGSSFWDTSVGAIKYWNGLAWVLFPNVGSSNAWTAVQSIKIGNTDQARNGLNARFPFNMDIEAGSAAVPTISKYQTSPNLYVSDWGSTDASGCITGMAAPCLSPLALFEGTNLSSTTSADLTGLMVNLYGAKAANSPVTWGNQWIGGAFTLFDSATPNVVQLTGVNPNVGALSVPSHCFKGTAGVDTTCGRVVNGMEIDVTNATATDGVFDSAIGNQLIGNSINYVATNATPKDGTYGLAIATGTVGHGFKFGQIIGGSTQIGLLIPQAGISGAPSIAGIHVASQGATGITIGTGSTTYAHGLAQTLANPTIGLLFDAQRIEGSTAAVQSNTMQFRAATGAATYANWKEFVDNSGNTHFQTDKTGSFSDFMTMNPNATPANNSVVLTGRFFGNGFTSRSINVSNTGTIALAHADTIYIRDTANTSDIPILQMDLSNYWQTPAFQTTGAVLKADIGVRFGTAISSSITAIQTQIGVTGCTTAASVGATCDTTVTWTAAFVDTNYVAVCSGNGVTSGAPIPLGIASKAAGNITFRTVALTAAAAKFTTIECLATHP